MFNSPKPLKIKICDLLPGGACSYYRGIGPLSKLSAQNISIDYITGVGWHTISDADILFLVRPQDNNYLDSIKIAKDFGIPVWIDYDDCLHKIPKDNPGYEYYSQTAILKCIEESCVLADIITVATEALKDFYLQFNKNVVTIKNAFNDYNYQFDKVDKTFFSVTWRGSNTHRKDVQSCQKEIIALSQKYGDIIWNFLGNDLWFITENIKKVFTANEAHIIRYFKLLKTLAAKIHIIPLVFNHFNLSKSNIAWIEATWAGSAAVAPNMPEFKKPGVSVYDDPAEFYDKTERLIKDEIYRYKQYLQSYSYIHDNLMLSKVNQKRIDVIEGLL